MSTTLTYDQAKSELEQIAADLENEAISIDELTEKIKRATFLVEFCQKKLKSTEAEVNKILKKWDQEA
jgi:exodeoxyribonuclease VII small subunit